ncbi:tetratricopeptide repeat protein [Pyxidicoccus parkwayensis]|uniref:Tetratricopeptide repeat protein n=1 Tax=Pyxidicoccus parkwayensis TaxID=2813578 RepID=A0ABX7P7H5_9BACT|nr:tetratricopeptide repeat protein [Pyxidicoccus parkwaysis]QSQ26418.1 tetratricopeptide repeat protein [Pyxidicoccus parkwaysis]
MGGGTRGAWLHGVALVGVLMLTGAVLATALPADFIFDDSVDVEHNPVATPTGFTSHLARTVRPLLKASYALGVALHGPEAPAHRAVNLGLHLAATTLVFLLLRRWLASHQPEARDTALPSLAGAALWVLHPLVCDTVIPISGRSMGLSTVLLLGALLFATGTRPPRAAGAVSGAVLALLAPLARETALVLPLLLTWWQATLGPREPWREALRRAAPIWAGTLVSALLVFLLPRHRELVAFSVARREPFEALRGNVHALSAMLRLWAAPWELSIDPARPREWGWLATPTLLRMGVLVPLGLIALLGRRKVPQLAFALGWALLALAPANSFLWRLDPVGIRPLYLASIAPAMLAGLVLLRARPAPLRAAAWCCALALAVCLGALTESRSALYRSPVALWEDAVRKAPLQARAHTNLGMAYLAQGRLEDAERALARALDLEPWNTSARCGLDALRIRRGATSQDNRELTE